MKDMKNDNCEELLSRVVDRLAFGDELTDEELTHLKAFAACREVLTAATQLEEDLMSRTIYEPDSDGRGKAVDRVAAGGRADGAVRDSTPWENLRRVDSPGKHARGVSQPMDDSARRRSRTRQRGARHLRCGREA